MSAEFAGLSAVVTGGASGIGLATATLLAERGARVACLDLNPEVPAPLLGWPPTSPTTPPCGPRWTLPRRPTRGSTSSSTTPASAPSARSRTTTTPSGPGSGTSTWSAWCARPGPRCRTCAAREHAAIVNLGSIAATVGLPDRALYSATKGAVAAFTMATAADLVREGIRVTCVNPGTVDTPWIGRLLAAAPDPAAERAALAARQPTGRLVTADEVAAAIAYLASPTASATTGMALAVDGGMDGLRVRPRG